MTDIRRGCQTDDGADTVVAGKHDSQENAFTEQLGTLATGSVEQELMRITGQASDSLHLQPAEDNAQEKGISGTG